MSVTSAYSGEQAIARVLELTGRPQITRETPWLVLTVGLPGSGKSTFARKLAPATAAVVLESDVLRCQLFAAPTHEPEESKLLFDALYGAAQSLLGEGVSVIVDATNLREKDRQRAYNVVQATGARLLILHFRAPERVIAARMAGRANHIDPEDRSTAGIAVYARMAESEEPIRREHWKIDTSDAAATESTLQRAIETLNTTLHAATLRETGGSIS